MTKQPVTGIEALSWIDDAVIDADGEDRAGDYIARLLEYLDRNGELTHLLQLAYADTTRLDQTERIPERFRDNAYLPVLDHGGESHSTAQNLDKCQGCRDSYIEEGEPRGKK